jgi:hypothetical protein
MRTWGVTYDTGFVSAGSTTHEPFDPAVVAADLRVIRDELGCEAVRITGGVADRLEVAARHAAEAGLEVWYCPFTNGLTRDELLAFLADGAERAERLRRGGASVVFLTGSEIGLFTEGFLPGADLAERLALITDPARVRAVLPAAQAAINDFLGRAVAAVRERFAGPVSYASLPFEGVDWEPFDIAATDAGYRDATNAAGFPASLHAMLAQGRPFAVTEFGCTTYRGAAEVGGRGDSVVGYDEHGRADRLAEGLVRDEEEQARYVRDLLAAYAAEGVEAAFVQTFACRHLPASDDPARDYDLASFGIVRVRPDGTWQPKAAFHAVAEFGRRRRAAQASAAAAPPA